MLVLRFIQLDIWRRCVRYFQTMLVLLGCGLAAHLQCPWFSDGGVSKIVRVLPCRRASRSLLCRFNDQFCKRKRNTFKDPQVLVGSVLSVTDFVQHANRSRRMPYAYYVMMAWSISRKRCRPCTSG